MLQLLDFLGAGVVENPSVTFAQTGNIGRSVTSALVCPCLVFGASSVEQGLGMWRLLTQKFCDWCMNGLPLGTEL